MASAVFEEPTLFRCYSVVKRSAWCLNVCACANVFSVFPVLLPCVDFMATAELSLVFLWWHSRLLLMWYFRLLLCGDVSGGAFPMVFPFCYPRNATKKSVQGNVLDQMRSRNVSTPSVQESRNMFKKRSSRHVFKKRFHTWPTTNVKKCWFKNMKETCCTIETCWFKNMKETVNHRMIFSSIMISTARVSHCFAFWFVAAISIFQVVLCSSVL